MSLKYPKDNCLFTFESIDFRGLDETAGISKDIVGETSTSKDGGGKEVSNGAWQYRRFLFYGTTS